MLIISFRCYSATGIFLSVAIAASMQPGPLVTTHPRKNMGLTLAQDTPNPVFYLLKVVTHGTSQS